MIDVYSWWTPNGHKVHIALEELGLPYRAHPVDITKGGQFEPAFAAISPVRKIPVIVDTDGPDGAPLPVFESGAILLYLAEKTGKLIPQTPAGRSLVLQWLMFQMSTLGPMFGHAQHFVHYAKEKVPYGIERYSREARLALEVMERRLGEADYLAGDYSIADIACFPWIRVHKLAGQTLADFPQTSRWYAAIRARPAVERGMAVLRDTWVDIRKDEQAAKILFGSGRAGDG
jgi:GST-like protein